MTVKKKILISNCSLLIIIDLVNCVFFDGSKNGYILNILEMVFVILGIIQNRNVENK